MSPELETLGYDRVRAHGPRILTARLDRKTEARLRNAALDPDFVEKRLGELDREWDMDRAILLLFAGMGLAALGLGLRKDARWRVPLAAQVTFLALHSLVGWSPQTMVLRWLGFRTRQEIDAERRRLLETLAR